MTPLSLILFLSCFSVLHASCIFDNVKPNISQVPLKFVSYGTTPCANSTLCHKRHKREADDLFQPIRIHVFFHNLNGELSDAEQVRLKSVVTTTVDQVEELLSVIPVEGNLILARSNEACKRVYSSGINEGKCATADPSYTGETCLDGFSIPEAHLEGVYVWDATDPEPRRTIREEGSGVADVDYILYVTSSSTTSCFTVGTNIIASASYCQLDQNGRPISGFINFCPKGLRPPLFNQPKSGKAAMHEMFHALGFSSDLFPKYQRCRTTEDGMSCKLHPKVVTQVLKAERMVTPYVVSAASEHFGCVTHATANEFGPILQTDAKGVVQSHWDAAFMYSSIMTPTIGLPHLISLDNITLAAFEDMGWYRVNTGMAEAMPWGKVGGCNFGVNPTCEAAGKYFCSGNNKGCHHRLRDKATCSSDDYLHNCRVFKAAFEDSCAINVDADLSTGEMYSDHSRCFFSSLSTNLTLQQEITGMCYEHRCNGTEELFVRIRDMDWRLCPWGAALHIPGFSGVLRCPSKGSLCHAQPEEEVTTTAPPSTPPSTSPHLLPPDDDVVYSVRITFPSASLAQLQTLKIESLFISKVIDLIVYTACVNERRIQNSELHSGSVLFNFDLHPAVYSDDGSHSAEVISVLRDSVLQLHNFTLSFNEEIFAASLIESWRKVPSAPEKTLPPGGIAGIAIATMLCCLGIAIFVYFMHRHHSSNTRVISNRVLPSSVYYAQPQATVISHSLDDHVTSLPHQPECPEGSTDVQQRRSSSVSARDVQLSSSHEKLHQL